MSRHKTSHRMGQRHTAVFDRTHKQQANNKQAQKTATHMLPSKGASLAISRLFAIYC